MSSSALLLALSLAAPGGPAGELRLAVVAGNNRGLEGEQRLEYAEEDARRVLAVLTELGGVAPGNAALVLGGGPAELLGAVGSMLSRSRAAAGEGPVALIVYVSAHADEEDLHLGGERLSIAALRGLLHEAPARLRIVLVDGCRLPVQAGFKGGRPGPEVPVAVDGIARVDGEIFISAASAGELAQEWTQLRGALFTHFLVVGLRGAADFDRNGRVTLAEAYSHAYGATLARAAEAGLPPQRPAFDLRLAGFGDWVFTRVGSGGAQITLAEQLAGRFWLVGPRGEVLAEVEKRPGEAVSLSLQAGRYRVIRVAPEWVDAADVNLSLWGARRIDPGDLVRVRAERALAKGGPTLELRPWSLVAGWSIGTASTAGMSLQQAGEAGIERAFGAWRARLMLGAGWSTTRAERATLRQAELRLPAAFALAFPVTLATVALGVEVRPRLVWQRVSRDVATGSLGGPLPGQQAFLVAAGPLVSASFPFRDRFLLGLEAWAGWEWSPGAQGSVARSSIAQLKVLGAWKL